MKAGKEKDIWLGLDLGTSSCKICALDPTGTIVATASEPYRTLSPRDGWAEQDPASWLEALKSAAGKLLGDGAIDPARVAAIALTSAAHIGVLQDSDDRPLRPALLWSDQRSAAQAAALRAECGDDILRITLNNVSTSWTLAHLAWVREEEAALWSRVARICLSKDYLLHWLTGRWVTDPATAVSAMLLDARSGVWSDELRALVGLQDIALPELAAPEAVVGTILPGPAGELGLPAGVPVVNGTLDSATETYGAGAVAAGDFVIRVGTAGGIHTVKDRPLADPRLLTYPHPVSGLWYSQGGTNAAGSAIAWALDAAGLPRSGAGFDQFSSLAASAPAGSDGLTFHPYLSGERTPYWDPALRGTAAGLSFRHGAAHLARAVIEGVAFSLKDAFLAVLASDGGPSGATRAPRRIRVVGGGVSDPLLMQILSSALDLELQLLAGVDSAYGAALLAMRRGGVAAAPGPDQAGKGRLDVADRIVSPLEADVPVYRRAFAAYRERAAALRQMYQNMVR